MVIDFEIIGTSFHHNRGQFIWALILHSGVNFEVEDGAIFGGIPIYPYIEMPRLLDDNGKPRLDVFVFRPLQPMQEGNFVIGQKVELVLPE
jgi:hypothetical protein